MARIPVSGEALSTLYEREVTLATVIDRLGFASLSNEQEKVVREKMGRSIGRWMQVEGQFGDKNARLNVRDLQGTLAKIADQLEEVSRLLAAVDSGVHHVHIIEVTQRLTRVLSENREIGSIGAARNFIRDFRTRAKTIAHGACVAAGLLGTVQTKRGRIRFDWFDPFTEAVMYVCSLNSIPAKVIVDRISGKPTGRFFDAARALERLLRPEMRARRPGALAQRLQRSLKRLAAAKRAQ